MQLYDQPSYRALFLFSSQMSQLPHAHNAHCSLETQHGLAKPKFLSVMGYRIGTQQMHAFTCHCHRTAKGCSQTDKVLIFKIWFLQRHCFWLVGWANRMSKCGIPRKIQPMSPCGAQSLATVIQTKRLFEFRVDISYHVSPCLWITVATHEGSSAFTCVPIFFYTVHSPVCSFLLWNFAILLGGHCLSARPWQKVTHILLGHNTIGLKHCTGKLRKPLGAGQIFLAMQSLVFAVSIAINSTRIDMLRWFNRVNNAFQRGNLNLSFFPPLGFLTRSAESAASLCLAFGLADLAVSASPVLAAVFPLWRLAGGFSSGFSLPSGPSVAVSRFFRPLVFRRLPPAQRKLQFVGFQGSSSFRLRSEHRWSHIYTPETNN